MIRLLGAAVLLFLALPTYASLLDDDRVFVHVDDGTRSIGIVTALAQDARGLLWIGTQDGLVRYDGYQFAFYAQDINDPSSLGGKYVRSLAIASDGRLWIGTLNSGVSIYDPTTDRFTNHAHSDEQPDSLSNNRVDAMVSDPDGGMWVGTNAGLDYWDRHSGKFVHYRHQDHDQSTINDDRIRSLLIDQRGDLWVGSWNGLNRRRKGSVEFETIGAVNNASESLVGKNLLRLFQDTRGQIWFGTPENGGGWLDPISLKVNWLPQSAQASDALSHPWVTGIAQSQEDQLWIATYGGGVNLVDLNTRQVIGHLRADPMVATGIGSDEIGPLLVDQSGLLWVGTWGAGLRYCNVRNEAFRMLRPSSIRSKALSAGDVASIMVAKDGMVWVGTSSNGIDLLDMEHGVIGGFRADPENPRALADGSVTALAQAIDHTVWVGTRQTGLYRLREGKQEFKRYSRDDGLLNNYVHRILPMADGNLWIGTSGGLNRFDVGTEQFHTVDSDAAPDVPFEQQIDALVVDGAGTLWVGAETGLFALRPGESRLRLIADDPDRIGSLAGTDVNGLLVDRQDRLWVSTAKGLELMRSWDGDRAEFDSITTRLGRPGNGLGTNMLEDNQGRIWTSESNMVVPEVWSLQFFGLADGLDLGTSWIRAYAQLADGRMLYGGSNGLVVVDADKLEPWDYDPPLVITEASVDGQSLVPPAVLVLPPGTRSFSIGFAALDYTDPKKNKYAFRLDPYDRDWVTAASDRRIATYTNLDPGSYELQVRGSNRLGKWATQQLTIDVEQQPSWYQTALFKSLVAMVVLLLLYLTYRLRVRQLHAAQQKLHAMVQARTVELEQAMRQVEQASLTDPLTGLRNRRYLQEHIQADVDRSVQAVAAGEKNHDMVFFLVDIDRFKAVNDQHGHAAGDAVLVQFAELLRQAFRPSDILLRWGGEEFLVLSRFVDRAQASKAAERVRSQIEAHEFELPGGRILKKTCSIGYAAFPWLPADPEMLSWEQVVDIADIALLAAKRSQRNAWIGILAPAGSSKDDADSLAHQPATAIGRFGVQSSITDPARICWE
ncbi:MAG: two-component regulator propeller domain-containing protein [Lysobacterales bacterium]